MIDELVKDAKRNGKLENILAAGVPPEVAAYLQDTVWGFLEALTEEVKEMDEDLQTAIEQTDDLLHGKTAAVFAGVIELGRRMAKALAPVAAADQEVAGLIAAFTRVAQHAEGIIADITIPDDEEEGDDEDDDDDEDDGEEKKS